MQTNENNTFLLFGLHKNLQKLVHESSGQCHTESHQSKLLENHQSEKQVLGEKEHSKFSPIF